MWLTLRGYNIGLKVVDEYMAGNPVCSDFKQVVNSFAKVVLTIT